MKKLLLVATIGIAGLMSAKSVEVKESKLESNLNSSEEAIWYPVKITSSCGYTEYLELGNSDISCLEVEINRMEDDCDAPVEAWGWA